MNSSMQKLRSWPLSLAALAAYCLVPHIALAAPTGGTNCSQSDVAEFQVSKRGPLRLESVVCDAASGLGGQLSPDGISMAAYGSGAQDPVSSVEISRLTAPPVRVDVGSLLTAPASIPIVVWSSGSRFIWAARREVVQPSHFFQTGLVPIQVSPAGLVKALPTLHSAAGPMDRLYWLNGQGLGLAAFGTNGDYYRPQHTDENPTYSIVDLTKGETLDSLSYSALKTLIDREKPRNSFATASLLSASKGTNGHAVVLFGAAPESWIVWTQGRGTRLVHNVVDVSKGQDFVLTPDANSVLVKWRLVVSTVQREHSPSEIQGSPVDGTLVSLISLKTGKSQWAVNARVTANFPRVICPPVIRNDGLYALVGLPANGGEVGIALVDMRGGRTLQVLHSGSDKSSNIEAMGFFNRGVWVRSAGRTARYLF